MVTWSRFFLGERAAQNGTEPEHAKQFGGRQKPDELLGAVRPRHVQWRCLDEHEGIERTGSFPPRDEVRRMHVQRVSGLEWMFVEDHDPIGIGIRQRSKQNGVDVCEDGGICTNADRK